MQAILKGMEDFKSNPLMGCQRPVIAQGNGSNCKIMGGRILLPVFGIQFVK